MPPKRSRCRCGSRAAVSEGTRRPTTRRRNGDVAEALAERYLRGLGWTVLATQLRVGRDEIDVLALEPGPAPVIVVVEVRSHVSSRFGAPEESVDRRKIGRLYRAAAALRAARALPDGRPLPRAAWRVDLIAVDVAPALAPGVGGPTLRHHRSLEPG